MRQLHYTIQILLRGGGNFIKLMSLTLGLLIGILLFSQIIYELSYENFYHNPDNVVLLRLKRTNQGVQEAGYDYDVYRPAAADLREALPELVECSSVSTRFMRYDFYRDDKKIDDIDMILADTAYFQTIGIEVLQGDPRELASPDAVFISRELAQRLYADENPVGKVLAINNHRNVTIKGIYQDIPHNTVFYHNIVVSLFSVERNIGQGTWHNNDIYTILFRLKHPQDIAAMNDRVQKAVERYTETDDGKGHREDYSVVPLREVYVSRSDVQRRLAILGVLGFSIFFVSIMNYILAAVASFSRRAKAVGVHKCCGAGEGHVLGLFLWETALMVAVALGGCVLLMFLFRYELEDLLQVCLPELFAWRYLWVTALTVAILFLVVGFLPGRMFARIPVTQVFRRYTDSKRSWKCGLLFVQFVGAAFILGMLFTTIWQYYDLMNRNIGFNEERLVVSSVSGDDLQGVEDAIRRQPYVEAVERSTDCILSHYSTTMLLSPAGEQIASTHFMFVPKNYARMMGLELIEGRFPEKEGDILVGEEVVKTMKWTDGAIGKQFPIESDWMEEEGIKLRTITGVVKNVRNMGFFREQTYVAFIVANAPWSHCMNVRLKEPATENLARLNTFVRDTYPKVTKNFTSYRKIREWSNKKVYRFRNTVWVTSGCILFIVLMGLIGYVNDETGRRSKEIAIRKVNGADAVGILRLLSIDILKIAVGAITIGMGLAYYMSGIWMKQFADGELPSPIWYVFMSGVVLILIVLVVLARAWRIANENPVNSIKSE